MSLVGEERKKLILDLLQRDGSVRTQELVARLDVSSESVRRYLEELEAENKLRRVYGGAVPPSMEREEPSHMKREIANAEAKHTIGQLAAEHVNDGDSIIISEGTTPLHMLAALAEKRGLKVLTNSVPVLSTLIDFQNNGRFDGDVWFVGGKVSAKHYRVCGGQAEEWMRAFHVDKAFIAVDGVSIDKGITTFDPDSGRLMRLFIERASQTYVLADSSKFGEVRLYQVGDMRIADWIVSESPAPDDWHAALAEHGVQWSSPE